MPHPLGSYNRRPSFQASRDYWLLGNMFLSNFEIVKIISVRQGSIFLIIPIYLILCTSFHLPNQDLIIEKEKNQN